MVAKKNKSANRIGFIILHLFMAIQGASGQELFFEKIQDPQIAIDTRIIGITKDSIGYIWFGTWNGLYRYDGERFHSYKFPFDDRWPFSNNRIRNIITDEQQQIWILTSDTKYIRYLYARDSFYLADTEAVPDTIRTLLESSANVLNYPRQIDQVRYFIEHNYFCSFDERTNEKKIYYPDLYQPGHLRDEYVSAFYIDKQRVIWVGTRNGRVYKANTNRNPFRLRSIYKEGARTPIVTSVTSVFKHDDELWLGTEYDGILITEEKTGTFIDHPVNKGNVKINEPRVIQKDRRGNIWIGSMDGLYFYSTADQKARVVLDTTTKPDIYNPYVYSISPADRDYIWAGIYQGLAKVHTTSLEVRRYGYHREFSRRAVRDVVVDAQQRVWVGTEGYCLFRFTYDTAGNCIDTLRIKDFKALTNGKLDGDCIYDIYEDSDHQIWVCTTEGLFCIEPSTMQVDRFSEAEGLSDQYITAITEDNEGNMWLAHKKGISSIDRRQKSISNYFISDDGRSWIFNEGSSFHDRENNTIYFGANEGYVAFEPDKISSNSIAPNLVLSQFYVSGNKVELHQKIGNRVILDRALYLTNEITLDYDMRDFGIDLTALDFLHTQGCTYQYQLEGYHEDWVSTNYGHLTFMQVPPGKYTLQAKAISSDGQESNTARLNIVILAPWYAASWAIGSYILLLLGVIVIWSLIRRSRREMKQQLLIERLNTEKQQEIARARLEFFTNVSHELRTPLSLIVDPLRKLKHPTMAADKQSSYLDLITRNVDQLSRLINQLLDFRKAEEHKLLPNLVLTDGIQLIYEAVMDFEQMAGKREIDLTFAASIGQLPGHFDEEKLRQIILNLVSNAFKYTPDHGSISVTVDLSEKKMTVSVRDSGVGINEQDLKKIFEPFNNGGATPFYGESSGMGLALTRNLVELLGGEISMKSEPTQGTQATFWLPYQKTDQPLLKRPPFTVPEKTGNGPLKQPAKYENQITILIVEDNTDLQFYLQKELSDEYQVLVESNGLDGLNTAVSCIPDIVISDVMMPLMDGNEMCKQLKTNDKTSHIPVILLTAKGTDQDRIKGLGVGADIYFSKPFNVEVLKAQIISIIDNRVALQKSMAQQKEIALLENEQNELDRRFMHSAIEVIQQNIDEVGLNPEQLAEQLQISQRQLYRKLKAITGSTVSEFIVRVRMEKASELLRDWQLNVSEVAYRVGFSEASNFSRSFRKHFGCSPSQYREQL